MLSSNDNSLKAPLNPPTAAENNKNESAESTALVAQSSTGAKIAKGVLMVVGSFAGILYLQPGGKCAESDTCGAWLSNAITKDGAHAVFTLSGLDFAGINVYMSGQSVEAFQNYLSKQESTRSKWVNGGLVMTFAMTQTISMFLSSIGTGAKGWQTAMTVGGAFPGSLYGAVNLATNELPRAISKVNEFAMQLYYRCCPPISHFEQQFRDRMAHYLQERNRFVNQVKANWREIVVNAKTLNIRGDEETLPYLFRQTELLRPEEGAVSKSLRALTQLGGVFLTTNFTLPIILNTFNMLEKYMPSSALSGVATAYFASTMMYGNLKLTMGSFDAFFDFLKNSLTGQPIESLPYQLDKSKTLMVAAASTLMSSLSYAVIATMWEKDYNWAGKNELGVTAKIGVDMYHLAGLFHLYHLVFSYATRDPKSKFLFKLEHEVEQLERITSEEFVKFVEKLPEQRRRQYGIEAFSAATALSDVVIGEPAKVSEKQPLVTATKSIQAVEPAPVNENVTYANRFWSLFGYGKKQATVEVIDKDIEKGIAYQPLANK